jgi:hypothetical protein
MDVVDRLLDLVREAFNELDKPDHQLHNVLRIAIRIARLRNDYDNLWWMEYEMVSFEDADARRRIDVEVVTHYTKDTFAPRRKQVLDRYLDERKIRDIDEHGNLVNRGKICGLSVPALQIHINSVDKEAESTVPPKGLHPVDLYFLEKEYAAVRPMFRAVANDYRAVLQRIEQRIHQFLSITEKELIYRPVANLSQKGQRMSS